MKKCILISACFIFLLISNSIGKELKLNILKEYELEENVDAVHSSISYCNFSPSNEYCVIGSFFSDYAVIYSTKDYKIVDIIKMDLSISDTAVRLSNYESAGYHLKSMRDADVESTGNPMISNAVKYAFFYDDTTLSTLIEAVLLRYPLNLSFNRNRLSFHRLILLGNINIHNKTIENKLFDLPKYNDDYIAFPQSKQALFDKYRKQIYTIVLGLRRYYDTLMIGVFPTTASYTSNAEFKEIIHHIPERLTRSGLKYDLSFMPSMALDSNNNLFLIYKNLGRVYNYHKKDSFDLVDLPCDNSLLLDTLAYYHKKEISNRDLNDTLFKKFLCINFDNISIDKNGNMLIVMRYFNDAIREYSMTFPDYNHFVQIYNKKGDLLKYFYPVTMNDNGELKHITTNSSGNLIFLRKNSSGWIIEEFGYE